MAKNIVDTTTIDELTDHELAQMVRGSIYAKGVTFGGGPTDARFLLVLAVPYGGGEGVETLPDAIEAFARLLQYDDWPERRVQVYDHAACQRFYDASREELE